MPQTKYFIGVSTETKLALEFKSYFLMYSYDSLRAGKGSERVLSLLKEAKKHIKPFEVMVDSGAFTLFKKHITFEEAKQYARIYAQWIRQYSDVISYFVELDLDNMFSYDKVLQLRRIIEDGTGRQPVLVYHGPRGKQGWYDMLKDYEYVGLGVGGKGLPREKKISIAKWFIRTAHEAGRKIHGFGRAAFPDLFIGWDSVDSTTWRQVFRSSTAIYMPVFSDGSFFHNASDYKVNQRQGMAQAIRIQRMLYDTSKEQETVESVMMHDAIKEEN